MAAAAVGTLTITALALVGSALNDGPGDAAYASTTVTITIRPGDTLSAIALRYHTTVAALAAANHIADPDRIVAGATLVVPAPAAPAPAGSAATPVTSLAVVVVQPGDTLSAIALRYHTTVAALAAANRIADPDMVFAGAHLTLPAPALPSGWGPGGPLPTALVQHPEREALRPAFLDAARASGEPASLIEALCWWESGWQAGARSSAGALGMCQLEPSTVNYVRTKLLHNAALDPMVAGDNVAMAAAYLADLTARAGGDTRTALAGYYQGLQSVQQKGMMPSTQRYVTGILNYSALFAAAG